MRLREQVSYNSRADDVFVMLCTEDFRAEVCRASGALRYDVTVTVAADTATIRTTRVVPADVPDVVKRFVGDEIEIVSTESWSGPDAAGVRTAELLVEIPGKPAQMRGSMRLEPTGSGAVETVDGEISVKVPFVGGRIEREVAEAIRAAITEEAAVGTAWLTR